MFINKPAVDEAPYQSHVQLVLHSQTPIFSGTQKVKNSSLDGVHVYKLDMTKSRNGLENGLDNGLSNFL